MKRKKDKNAKNESEFDKKIISWLFVFLFSITFITEGISRYMDYKEERNRKNNESDKSA